MSQLSQIEREAKIVRDFIAELKGLTPRFNATKERAEEELRLHLAKIDAEREKLGKLIDEAALIVQHLGAEVPPIAQPEEVLEPVVAVADSPQQSAGAWLETQFEAADEAGVEYTPEPEPTFEYVAAAVEQIAASPPEPDASDEPEMTDEQVERLEEQTAAALAEDVRERELETVGGDRPARRFNPFAANPFA